jgi:predicted nucleic acid-binding protein
MIILDTSLWIEFLKHNEKYYSHIVYLLENQKVIAVECIFGELLQGAKNKREIDIISLYYENLPKAFVNDGWLKAGIYSSANKLISKGVGLIDCFIIITARLYKAKIWSLDKKLNSLLSENEKYTFL